jgi:hypothetical protein
VLLRSNYGDVNDWSSERNLDPQTATLVGD